MVVYLNFLQDLSVTAWGSGGVGEEVQLIKEITSWVSKIGPATSLERHCLPSPKFKAQ